MRSEELLTRLIEIQQLAEALRDDTQQTLGPGGSSSGAGGRLLSAVADLVLEVGGKDGLTKADARKSRPAS